MLRIIVTANLKELKEFEEFLRSQYVIICKLITYPCRNICTCPYKVNRFEKSNISTSSEIGNNYPPGQYTIVYTVTNESPTS